MIITNRLTIRLVAAADWPAVRDIWAALAPLPMAQYDKPHSTAPEDVRARIARWADFTGKGTEHMFFAVCLDDAVIGYVAFNRRENGHEIGYSFHPAHHGKGYAKEALAALLAHLRENGFTRFSAGTALNNTPSVRLLTGLGFRLTGTEKVSFYKDEQGRDIVFDGGIFELDQSAPEAPCTDIAALEHWHFEMSEGPANYLLGLVLEGKKRATASSLRGYEIEGEPLPQEGALSVITWWDGTPGCVIRTTRVRVIPYRDITFDIAKLEGEDDDLASWQRHHQAFFEAEGRELGYAFSQDMPVIFEEFEVVRVL